MKNQTRGKIIFAILALLSTFILVSGVSAQVAPSNTWVSPSNGITVTVTSPIQPQNTEVDKFQGTGKNGAPKGTGKTDPAPIPTSCPRNRVTGDLYSETKDVKDKNGETIAKIRITRNVDCTTHSMTALDKDGNNPVTLTRR